MNIIQKIAISTIALGSLAAPMSALASSPHGDRAAARNERICSRIDMRQQKLIDRFNFDKPWQVNRFQSLVNRENARACTTTQTSFGYLRDFGNFESLTAALKYTGLDATLNGAGTFTVFAPTDNAFAKLPPSLVNSLLTDPAQKTALTNILLYHVVSGAAVNASTAATLTEATMANGAKVMIKQEAGNLFINDSKVVLYDIKTTNGIIHVLDAVLVPSS